MTFLRAQPCGQVDKRVAFTLGFCLITCYYVGINDVSLLVSIPKRVKASIQRLFQVKHVEVHVTTLSGSQCFTIFNKCARLGLGDAYKVWLKQVWVAQPSRIDVCRGGLKYESLIIESVRYFSYSISPYILRALYFWIICLQKKRNFLKRS